MSVCSEGTYIWIRFSSHFTPVFNDLAYRLWILWSKSSNLNFFNVRVVFVEFAIVVSSEVLHQCRSLKFVLAVEQ